MGLDRSGLGSLPCSSLSFVRAAISHDIDYHDCLVTFTPVEVYHLVLPGAFSRYCTLTYNRSPPLL